MEKVNCNNCGSENTINIKYCTNCGYELPKPITPVVESEPIQPDTFTSKINKRKGFFGALLGMIIFVLFIFLIKSFLFDASIFEKFKTAAIDKTMITLADQLNKNCPVAIDEYTRLDNIKAFPGRSLRYTYTLTVNKSDVDASALKEQIEPQILNSIRDSPQMEVFRTYKTTFVHTYHDKNGQTILEISITPDMYEQ